MQPSKILLVAATAAAALWVGNQIYRAHANLVTLNVRDMEVRRVVSKLEWQTWEHIVVNRNVAGKVTLNVRNVPLDAVLDIVGLQTNSRWTRVYPIYSTRRAAATFHKVLLGGVAAAGSGWQSLQQAGFWQRNNVASFANMLRAKNNLVSVQFLNKDINFAAFALSRFSKAEVVAEDGIPGIVLLRLQQVPFETAVAKVAKQVHRKWGRFYTLQPLNAAKAFRPIAAAPGAPALKSILSTNAVVTNVVKALAAKVDDQAQTNADRALEAFMATMSPEERSFVQTQLQGVNQAGGAAQAQRQQLQATVTQAAQADVERQIQNRLKNGTVDQRIAHDRQMIAKQRAAKK